MKKLLSFALVLALLLSLCVPAFAEEAQYALTKDFIQELNTVEGFSCEFNGTRQYGKHDYEAVYIEYAGGEFSDYTSKMTLLFAEDSSEMQFIMYNLCRFDAADLDEVVHAVNDLNADSSGVKLYVDKSDNTVTAELFLLSTEDSALDIAEVGVGFMISFTDSAYERLESFRTN